MTWRHPSITYGAVERPRAACAALEYIITMMNMNSATGPNVKLTAIGKRPEDVEYT